MEHQPIVSQRLLELLVQEGILDSSNTHSLEERTHAGWIPLGRILREQGKVTMAQLMDLLQVQAAEPHMRLGDLALRQGLCTPEDIEQAMSVQRASSPHVLDLLLADEGCDHERLCAVLVRYVRELETQVVDARARV